MLASIASIVALVLHLSAFFKIENIDDLRKKLRQISFFQDEASSSEPLFSKDSKFNILLLPFESLRDDKKRSFDFERIIQIRLTEMSEQQKLGISVALDTIHSQPTSNSDAREIGKEIGADLVIWGTSFKISDVSEEATLKYVLVNDKPYRLKESDESPTEQIHSYKDIMEGRLLRNVDYIIYWTVGLEASTRGDCAQADYYFNNIFTKFPKEALDSYLKLGVCFMSNNNFCSADSIYTKTINLGFENERIYEAYFNRANARYEKGEFNKALDDINVAIENDYSDSVAYFSRGLIKSRLNDSTAVDDLDTAIQLEPRNEFAYFHRGKIRRKWGDFDGALADYNTSIELNPGIAFFYNHRASVKVSLNDLDGALRDINTALGLNPNDAYSFVIRGVIEERKGNLTRALDYFDRAVATDSNHVLAYLYRGAIKEKYTGYFDDIIKDFEKVLQLDSNYVGIPAAIKRVKEKKRAFEKGSY